MTKEFIKVYKKLTSENIPEEMQNISKNLNICGNINLKQFLLLFENVSSKFPFQGKSFKWESCFEGDALHQACPDKLKKKIKENPLKSQAVIRVLNSDHYGYMLPSQNLKLILALLANTFSENFDSKIFDQGEFGIPEKEG